MHFHFNLVSVNVFLLPSDSRTMRKFGSHEHIEPTIAIPPCEMTWKSCLAFISRLLISQHRQRSLESLSVSVCLIFYIYEMMNFIGKYEDFSVNLPIQITHKNKF